MVEFDFRNELRAIGRFAQLTLLAVITFVGMMFILLASDKFNYPMLPVLACFFLLIGLFLSTVRNTLILTVGRLDHDMWSLHFQRKNRWGYRTIEKAQLQGGCHVRIDKWIERGPKGSRQEWHTLVVRPSEKAKELRTISYGDSELAERTCQHFSDYLKSSAGPDFSLSVEESNIGAVFYFTVGFVLLGLELFV